MKNNLFVLKYETKRDLDMFAYIGLKDSPHWNSVIVGMKRLRDFEAELPKIAKTSEEVEIQRLYSEIRGDKPAKWVRLDEILGEEGGEEKT